MRRTPRPAAWLLLLSLLLAAPLLGCIEDRLAVDVTTRIQADGSCLRRIEYHFERVDSGKEPARRPRIDESAFFRLHRFPSGDPWSVVRSGDEDSHSLAAEALLPSLNDLDWDYWRSSGPQGPPARNYLSFAMESEPGSTSRYEYSETFLDPASPLAWARTLAQALQRSDDVFAAGLERSLGARRPGRGAIKRAYRERFASPFAREVATLADRPVFGPRERQLLERLLSKKMDELQSDLVGTLAALAPGTDPGEMKVAADAAGDELGTALEKTLEGTASPWERMAIHFRVTLVMPAPIVRANACTQGDTVVWEFDQDDLYGRGFEMWARAEAH